MIRHLRHGLIGLGVLGMLAMAPAAQATPSQPGVPITTPSPLSGNGTDVQAVFVFANAADTDKLSLTIPSVILNFFNNKVNVPGDQVDLGNLNGPIQFLLSDTTKGLSFFSDIADVNGNFHIFVTSNFADFNVNGGVVPAAAQAALTALANAGNSIIFVGWEDRTAGQHSDFDYNDLIFAFTNLNVPENTVPEPLTLSLFGAGLAGAAALRRRKASKTA